MPQNKLLYFGLLVIAASALIYVANWITNNIAYFVPIAFGVGCLLIILGLVQESKKKQAAKEQHQGPPAG